jgi:DNA-binding CsgD family transcriptional regulator
MLDLLQVPPAMPMPPSQLAEGALPPVPWLALMLDEIDYGMLLLADESNVLHANHVARSELDDSHPLQLLGSQLRVRHPGDLAPLRAAVADAAKRGLRRLVTLGEGDQRITLAVVPLAQTVAHEAGPHTLLVFGKRRMCPALSAHWFARSHGLTPAETRVLSALCEGHAPCVIAQTQGVALSTVRSQIGAIRNKTGAESIRALVRQVAVLPPLVSALRGGAGAAVMH